MVIAVILLSIVLAAILSVSAVFFSTLSKTAIFEKKSKARGYEYLNKSAQRGQIVFCGDSITEGFRVNEFFADYTERTGKSVYNRGINAEISAEMSERFESNILSVKPSTIVILMGTNDLGKGIAPRVTSKNIASVLKLTREQCPDANILLEAVYPTNNLITGKLLSALLGGGRTRKRIDKLNDLLEQEAKKYGAVWLDLSEHLSDSKSRLKADFTVDGLHLNAAGYKAVTENILPLLK
jgi:lysophospholipase L1-like esterase